MNRNDIASILTGLELTDAQVKGLLDINSADITKALGKQKDELSDANDALAKAQETISRLETAGADAEQLRNELQRYREVEQQRAAAEQAAAAEAQTANRFKTAMGSIQFVNDYTRDGVLAQFRDAIADPANAGRGDTEVLAALIKDKPGLLANPNPGVNIPGPATLNNPAITAEAFKALPLVEQMKWANTNPEMYARMSEIMQKG